MKQRRNRTAIRWICLALMLSACGGASADDAAGTENTDLKGEVTVTLEAERNTETQELTPKPTEGTNNPTPTVVPAGDSYQERAIINEGNTFRIQKLLERAQAGEKLTIGFIGGSITQGSGASGYDKCYASLVYDWWCKTFPQAEFTMVNAGIGATTSQFACARVKQDLLDFEPDFVVVEFSVNDSNNAFFAETYESLLRMILESSQDIAVMILNMVQYNDGVNAQGIHNPLAQKYGIPAVSMKNSIYREIIKKRLAATDVSADMLHPNDWGHAYGAELVTYYLTKVMNGAYPASEAFAIPELSEPLCSMTSKRYDNRNTTPVLNGFVKDETVQNGVQDVFRNGYTAKEAGASILFENIYGSRISLQYRKTNSLGAPLAAAIIDGNEDEAIVLDGNFENGWGDWLYMHDLTRDLDPGIPHTVEVRITEAGKKDFYLVSVIAAGEDRE